MNHYICTGECHGESDKPGTCQATNCSRHGKPLTECHCDDGRHEMQPAMEGLSQTNKEAEG